MEQNNDRISSLLKTRTDRFTAHLDKMKAKNKAKDAFVLELKEMSKTRRRQMRMSLKRGRLSGPR